MSTYGKQTGSGAASGGFGADTSVPVNNSNSVPVTAAELITSLLVNTAGSEAAQFLIKLLVGGVQANLFKINSSGLTLDPGSVQTVVDLIFSFAGAPTASIRGDSAGNLRLSAASPIGGVNFYNNAAQLGNELGRISNNGWQMFNCPLQQTQGPNTASANDLVLNGTFSGGNSGNAFNITGSTQMNRLDYLAWQDGTRLTLRCTGTPLIKHNQAASGTVLPYFFRSGADFQVTANDTIIDLVLMAAAAGGTPTAWYCLNH